MVLLLNGLRGVLVEPLLLQAGCATILGEPILHQVLH